MNSQQKFILAVAILITFFLFMVLLNRELRDHETIVTPVAPTIPFVEEKRPRTPSPVALLEETAERLTPIPALTLPVTMPTLTPELAGEYFVSPDGKENASGSKQDPWSLEYALSHPEKVDPGDTIWLLGGIYEGQYLLALNGAEGKPIIVRAYSDERVTLSHEDRVLDVGNASYVYLWGLEITATENKRDAQDRRRSAYGIRINQGETSHHIKFINMVIHDVAAQGIGWWAANADSEIYGSVIYFNGSHNQFDHGIYVHNADGNKLITDNFIFHNASHGIHAYGEGDQQLNSIYIEGNTVFNNGSIGYSTSQGKYGIFKRNILLGGHLVAQNPVIRSNYTYYPGTEGAALNLGYRAGSAKAIVEDNYFAGGEIEIGGENSDMVLKNNTIIGANPSLLTALVYVGNELLMFRPSKDEIFIRPNQYEPGRANITIYNWRKLDTVIIWADQLEGVDIQKGDQYALFNVQDYYEDVVFGVYDGVKIEVPMMGRSVAQPLGLEFKPDSTFPEFGAFVLIVR